MGQEHFGLVSSFASESVSSSSAFRLRPASSSRADSASVSLNERNYGQQEWLRSYFVQVSLGFVTRT